MVITWQPDLADKATTEWVKIVGGLLAFAVGLQRYTVAQRWKRREFIAQQIRDFEADMKIEAVLTMLDWTDRPIQVRSNKSGRMLNLVVNERLLQISLLPCSPQFGFTDEEAAIRDCFDRFLDALVRLEAFVKSKLISQKELKPYVSYWVKKIVGREKPQHEERFYILLHRYIDIYEFSGARRLIENYAKMPTWSIQVIDAAIANTLADAKTYRQEQIANKRTSIEADRPQADAHSQLDEK
jgi:hypothetical protein